MSRKHLWSLVIGAVMTAVGLVLYFGYHDVETPVIGLRQLGAVLAVIGVIDMGVAVFSLRSPTKKR